MARPRRVEAPGVRNLPLARVFVRAQGGDPMNPIRLSVLAVPLALAACGGTAREDAFRNAAPSTAALAIDVDAGTTATSTDAGAGALLTGADACHPLLFLRTQAVARRLNRHFAFALARIEDVIASHPVLSTDATMVWTQQRDGLDVRFTMTRAGEVFTWKLELRVVGASDAAWAIVFSGQIDRSGATGAHQGTGAFVLDLDALHAVLPTRDVAGELKATFSISAEKRLVAITAGGVRWDLGMDGDLARVAPLDATYTYLREPGVGGSLVLRDSMVFFCPANPTLAPAAAELVSRWYRTSTGEIHGRSDARATGGQLPSGETWVGVTCHARPADPTRAPAELYWMVKEEDASGATVASWQVQSGAGACDAAFGAVPSATDASTDFDFGAVTEPYPFPGMF
jgi:hypothetical protein